MTHSTDHPLVPVGAAAAPTQPTDVSARLYQAAIGPVAQPHYLRVFADFDAAGRPGLRWHGPACVSALNWLAARGLWVAAWCWAGTAVLGSVALLGVARLLFDLSGPQLAAVLAMAVLLVSVAWGALAHAFYYRVCNRRILQAVAGSRNLDEACRLLQARAQRRGRWPALVALNTALVLLVAAGLPLLRPQPVASVRPDAGAPSSPPAETPSPTPATSAAEAVEPAVQEAAEPAEAASAPGAEGEAPDAAMAPASGAGCADCPAHAMAPAASPATSAVPPPAPRPAKTRAAMAARTHGFAVQVGVFAQAANVRKVLDALDAAAIAAYAEPVNPPADSPQRVRAGPYATREQAEQAAARIRALALPAVVVRLGEGRAAR